MILPFLKLNRLLMSRTEHTDGYSRELSYREWTFGNDCNDLIDMRGSTIVAQLMFALSIAERFWPVAFVPAVRDLHVPANENDIICERLQQYDYVVSRRG